MLKIGIVSTHFGHMSGGAEINDTHLGRAFQELGHEMCYFTIRDPKVPWICDNSLPVNAVEMKYWYPFTYRLPGLIGKAMRHVFESIFAFRVFQKYASELGACDLILLTGRPLLAQIKSGVPGKVIISIRGKANPRYYKWCRGADGTIFWGGSENDNPSEFVRSLNYLPLDPSVNTKLFTPGEPDITFRKSLGWDDCVLLVTVGRLLPVKQIHTIISSAAALQQAGTKVTLLIIGDGELRDQLEYQADDELLDGTYLFTGSLPNAEVAEYVRNSDIFIMNSVKENHPIALKEAMCTCTYAVAPDIGRVPKIIDQSEYGLVFPRQDEQILTDTLEHVIESRLFSRSRNNIRSPVFRSWQENAVEITRFYYDMLIGK